MITFLILKTEDKILLLRLIHVSSLQKNKDKLLTKSSEEEEV
jgi:hypothetical protein